VLSIFSGLIATFITVPVLALIFIYLISYRLSNDRKKSFHRMVDYSTIFFIISVYTMVYVIWERSLLLPFLMLLITIAMVFAFLQWKYTQDIQLGKLLKGFWRFNFLLFFAGYCGLLIFGLVLRIFSI
jgi:hypothetical protein